MYGTECYTFFDDFAAYSAVGMFWADAGTGYQSSTMFCAVDWSQDRLSE